MEDQFERGARLSEPVGPFEPLPPRPRLLNPWLLLAGFAALALAVALIRRGPGAPTVPSSCSRPAFALDRTSVRVDGVVRWTAAGPADARVVVGADTAELPTTGRLAGPVPLPGCRATGQFGARLPEGDHTITFFLVRRDGSAQRIGTRKLTVTGP
ncbi:MAG: hypothetical protein WCD35_10595 [Mycobacteriales bacterium]